MVVSSGTLVAFVQCIASFSDPIASLHPLRAAKDALGAGNADAARARLDADDGWNVTDAHDLYDYRAFYRGKAAFSAHEFAKAKASLLEIPRTLAVPDGPSVMHPLWPAAVELLADIEAMRSATTAAGLLLKVPPNGHRLEKAAGLMHRAGNTRAAYGIENRLLLEAATSTQAQALAERLGTTGVVLRLKNEARVLARARALLVAHDNAGARELVREGLLRKRSAPLQGNLRCEALYVTGKAARKMRDYKDALAMLTDVASVCKAARDDEHRMASSLLLVDIHAIQRNLASVRAWVRRMEKDGGAHRYVDDALLTQAELEARSGALDAARATLNKMLRLYATADRTKDAAWKLVQMAVETSTAGHEVEVSLETLLARRDLDPIERARAAYWRARIQSESGRSHATGDPCHAFEEAAFSTTLTFYTWLSLSHVRRTDPACAHRIASALLHMRADAKKGWMNSDTPLAAENPVVRRARRLIEIGLNDEALELLRLTESPRMTSTVIDLYSALGAHADIQRLLRANGTVAKRLDAETGKLWRLLYPLPFASFLSQAAKEASIDPLLLAALVREESIFDPDVKSWAGAIGLAQLMPETAMLAARALRLPRSMTEDALREPQTNLRLGAQVLGDNLRLFDRVVPLALVAYNAGPGAARRFLPKDRPVPFDRWCESIPIRETRVYINHVIQSWGIYRLLYDEEAPFIDLPEKLP